MNIIQAMRDKAEEKAARVTTYPVRELPDFRTLPVLTFLGSYSYTLPALKTRYALEDVLITDFGQYQTPTEASRDYLAVKYTSKIRQFSDQYQLNAVTNSWPYLARPGNYGECVYIDLKAAYWTIVQIAGWDVDYAPGKFWSRRSIMNDYPLWGNKLARNTLVSTSALSHVNVWNAGAITTKNIGNRNWNPNIGSLVQDVLHGVASDMEELGAVYVHTDGYIVPEYLERAALLLIQERWGLPARIKARGYGMVRGVGAYAVGETVSKRLNTLQPVAERHIMPRAKPWLRERVRGWRERTKLYYGFDDTENDVDVSGWQAWGGG